MLAHGRSASMLLFQHFLRPSLSTFHRHLIITPHLYAVMDSRVFVDPIVDKHKLYKEKLAADDQRNFLYIKPMKSDETPVFYRDRMIDKFVRVSLNLGKDKEMSRDNVYGALEIIKRRQYKRWRNAVDEEERASIELDPVTVFHRGMRNCYPLLRLVKIVRGGTAYQVPAPLKESQAEFRAMKTMRDICIKKSRHGQMSWSQAVANELIAANNNEGATVQAKQELHKQCEANRAYVHYRFIKDYSR